MLNTERFLKDLKKLVAYNSVYTPNENGTPFGVACDSALREILNLAESFGFKTENYDGYAGEITFGEGEEIGIIGHVDVVPSGNGWDFDPFTLTVKDGVVYGRGVADDKGPTLAALYALKALKDSEKPCRKKFRLFIGTNEETGWKDIEYLKTKTVLPEYGFSPDGNFPVSYAEKGVYLLNFKLPNFKRFHGLSGGTVINAVCDYATVNAEPSAINPKLLEEFGLSLKNGNLIVGKGVSAHGSLPQNGINAFKNIFSYMLRLGEDVKPFTDFVFGDKLNIFGLKNEQGNVTFSPDLIQNGWLCCDMRIPAPFTEKDVIPILNKFGIPYTLVQKHPPFMVDKNCELVIKLLNAYNSQTGENATPVSMGGSTFARVFEKGCAFGFEFEGFDFNLHKPNENIPLNLIEKGYEILEKAIFSLAEN